MRMGACILIKYNNEVLAIKRPNSNYLGLPGGKLEPGEDFFEAAKRELFEETGVICPDTLPLLYEGECVSILDSSYAFFVKTYLWEIKDKNFSFNTTEETQPHFVDYKDFLSKTEFRQYNMQISSILNK